MSLNPLASEDLKKKRMALCQVCPHRRENIPGYEEEYLKKKHVTPWNIEKQKCNLCGCYMPAKTGIQMARCPVKKW